MSNRRRLYRLPTYLQPLKAAEIKPGNNLVPTNLLILNLSGGGMLAKVDRELERGALVQVTLDVGAKKTLTLRAQVVHVSPGPEGKRPTYHLGCSFVDLPQADEDTLIGFIFSRQVAAPPTAGERLGAV